MNDLMELADFLTARIEERQEDSTPRPYDRSDPRGSRDFPFFEWLEQQGSRAEVDYGSRNRLQPHEVDLIRQNGPVAILDDCSAQLRIIDFCKSAITFAEAPGMVGARILAERILMAMADKYRNHDDFEGQWEL